MKMITQISVRVLAGLFLFSGLAQAQVQSQAVQPYMAPIEIASLTACDSRALTIELNVDGRTPKHQMVEAIKILADDPNFSVTPVHSEQSTLAFRAELVSACENDSCARAVGWFDLQARLERFKGVAVSCEKPEPKVGGRFPAPRMPAPGAPGAPGGGAADPNQPPPPGAGGVTGGN